MTLDETWEKCLAMWKWIAEQYDPDWGARRSADLKSQWLKENFGNPDSLQYHCFFCHYASIHIHDMEPPLDGWDDLQEELDLALSICAACPGGEVEENFNCERSGAPYHWIFKPVEFYHHLVELNERRLRS